MEGVQAVIACGTGFGKFVYATHSAFVCAESNSPKG